MKSLALVVFLVCLAFGVSFGAPPTGNQRNPRGRRRGGTSLAAEMLKQDLPAMQMGASPDNAPTGIMTLLKGMTFIRDCYTDLYIKMLSKRSIFMKVVSFNGVPKVQATQDFVHEKHALHAGMDDHMVPDRMKGVPVHSPTSHFLTCADGVPLPGSPSLREVVAFIRNFYRDIYNEMLDESEVYLKLKMYGGLP